MAKCVLVLEDKEDGSCNVSWEFGDDFPNPYDPDDKEAYENMSFSQKMALGMLAALNDMVAQLEQQIQEEDNGEEE